MAVQGRRKVWKSGGPVVLGGDNVPPPGRDRVNWSAQNWGVSPHSTPLRQPCIVSINQRVFYILISPEMSEHYKYVLLWSLERYLEISIRIKGSFQKRKKEKKDTQVEGLVMGPLFWKCVSFTTETSLKCGSVLLLEVPYRCQRTAAKLCSGQYSIMPRPQICQYLNEMPAEHAYEIFG